MSVMWCSVAFRYELLNNGVVDNCWIINGTVFGDRNYVGGLIGRDSFTVTASYYDTDVVTIINGTNTDNGK